ncbi:DUF418 domain-containing protein [Microbacterium aureliae]
MAAAPGLTRLDGPGRVAGVDLARGLAVVGMLAAHLLVTDERVVLTDPATWDGVVNGNSSILFATLAGVSIGLTTGGATPLARDHRGAPQGRLLLRAAALWVIGVLLVFTGVPVFVILPAYAVLFALAVPLVGLTAPALWAISALTALVMPWVHAVLAAWPGWATPAGSDLSLLIGWHYPFEVWIGFVVAGLALARSDLARPRTLATAAVAGAAGAAAVFALDAATGARALTPASEPTLLARVWTAEPHSSGLLEVWASGALAIAVIAAAILVCRPGGAVARVLLPLRAVGAMPLTAYMAQILVWAVASALLGVAGDLAGFRAFDPFWPLTIGLVAACTLWALFVGRGPLESLLARLSRAAVREN